MAAIDYPDFAEHQWGHKELLEDVRIAKNPRQSVLDFLESAYVAGASLSGWNVEVLTTPPLDNI